jgi:YggT family protein
MFNSSRPLYDLGQLYLLIMIIRAVFSYFPYSPESPLNPVRRFVVAVTEPVLVPFRRIIPPVGMFDLSFLVAIIVIEIIVTQVLARLP